MCEYAKYMWKTKAVPSDMSKETYDYGIIPRDISNTFKTSRLSARKLKLNLHETTAASQAPAKEPKNGWPKVRRAHLGLSCKLFGIVFQGKLLWEGPFPRV